MMLTIETRRRIVTKIKVNGQELEAVEISYRLKVWPPEAAPAILEAVKRRSAVTATEVALAYAQKGRENSARNGKSGRPRKERTSKEIQERWQLGSAWDLPRGGEEW